MEQMNLERRDVITGRDLEEAARAGVKEVLIRQGAVLTPTARDAVGTYGLKIKRSGAAAAPGGAASSAIERIFNSPEAQAAKKEIASAGRKLWHRGYVDGNGGNISYRIRGDYALCTPTLLSKGDLTPDDICMVDLNGTQVAGHRRSTSEIKLHLEAFKAQPKAGACIHAHPPHATAYAAVGKVPPTCIISEAEVLVGQVALAPYETPGTREVAEKIIPLVTDHNTVLLANHGILTWADTVTHAEWLVEVVDTYCQTLILASQLGAPINRITDQQSRELLEIKKKLDIPDPRISGRECTLCDTADSITGITVDPAMPRPSSSAVTHSAEEVEAVIQEITDKVYAALRRA